MARGPGRDQRGPLERLVRLAAALSAHPKRGLHVDRLVDIAGFEQTDEGRDQLTRDLRQLERQGWQFVTTLAFDGRARYRMITTDNRLRVRLSLPQLAALQRAALLIQREDLVESLGLTPGEEQALTEVLEALRHRARIRYRYKGSSRLAHPQLLRQQSGTWYLRAVEEGSEDVKTFAVSRMSKVSADQPDTGRRVPTERHIGLHPMLWEVDPPVEVMLRTPAMFRPDVVRWLLEPITEEPEDGEDDAVRMRYRVTNRAAFRDRVYELGTRVEVLGPREVREELLAELAAAAGGGG